MVCTSHQLPGLLFRHGRRATHNQRLLSAGGAAMFTRIRLVITVAGITAAAVSAALLSLTAAHGASGTPQRQEDAQAVGSLLTAPLPVPPEISLWPADSRN